MPDGGNASLPLLSCLVPSRASGEINVKDQNKTKRQLLSELAELRQKVATLADLEARRRQMEEALRESEDRYRMLFEDSPVILLEQDFSAVKAHLDHLREAGVQDFRSYFEINPEAITQCAALMRVIDVNQATLDWYQVKNKEALRISLSQMLSPSARDSFREELVAIAERKAHFELESIRGTRASSYSNIVVKWAVAPGYEDTWSKVLVSIFDVTERKRVEEDLQSRLRETLLLNRVISAAALTLEPNAVLKTMCEELAHALDLPQAAVALLDSERSQLTVVAEYCAEGRPSALGAVIPVAGNQATQYVLEHRAPLVVANAQTDERQAVIHDLEKQRGVVSLLIVPLLIRDQVIGTLGLDALETRDFSSTEITLAQSVAASAAQVLEHAELYASVQRELAERKQAEESLARRAREMAALYKTSLEVNSHLDLSTLLQAIVERATGLLGMPMGGLYRLKPDGETLEVVAGHNTPNEYVGIALRMGEGVAGRVAQSGRPLIVKDYSTWEGRAAAYADPPFRRVLGVPLKSGDSVTGVIVVDDDKPGSFSDDDVRLVSLFADQAAIAVENAQLYEAVQHELAERRRAEMELRQSEARFRNAFENAPIGMAMVGLDDRILQVNQALCDILGYTREELLATTVAAITHADDRQIEATYKTTMHDGQIETFQMEKRYLHADGHLVWGQLSVSLVKDQDGHPLYYLGQMEDITERKKAVETLLESEQRYRTLFAAAQRQAQELNLLDWARSALARELDLPVVFRTIAEAVAEVFGYTLVSLYLLRDETLVLQHQVGYDKVVERIPVTNGITGRVVRTGKPVLLENVRTDPDFLGAMEGITSKVCVPLMDQGRVVGVLNVESTQGVILSEADLRLMMALSEHVGIAIGRARLYTEISESERRFRALIENSSDVVSVIDAGGIVRYTSPSATRILGYSIDEHVGRTAFELVHPDDLAEAAAAYHRLLGQPGASVTATMRIRHWDGSWRWIEVVGSDLLADPSVRGIVVNFRDISERKRVEEALARHAREMEALYQTSLEINAQPDLPTLLRAIVERASELLGARMGALYMTVSEGEALELVVGRNLPDELVGIRLEWGEGLSGRVAQTGKPLMVADYRAWEGRATVYAATPFRRVLGVPLKTGDSVIGVINVTDDQRTGLFTEDEVRLVTLFADQAAVAIEKARLYQAEREQYELAETLRQVSATLISTLDVHVVLDRILEQVSRVVPYDAANIMFIEGGSLRVARWRGYDRFGTVAFMSTFTTPVANMSGMAQMIATLEPLLVSDARVNPGLARYRETEWVRSYASALIHVRGEVIGLLNVDSATPGFFGQNHADRLSVFADQAAIAVENARLYQAEQEQRELAQTLREVSSILVSTLDTDAVLDHILEQVGHVVPNDAANVMLIEGDQARIVRSRGYERFGVHEFIATYALRLPDAPSLHSMVETGEPVVIPDTHGDPRWIPHPKTVWIRSYAGAPIRVRGAVIGYLNVDSATPGFFGQTHADRLRSFADQAAIAIANAGLYATEQQRVAAMARALEQQRELDRLQREFIQNVSHELRTPLGIVMGHAELLESGELGDLQPDQQQSVGVIVRRVQMLGKLVTDITAVLETETRELKREPLDLIRLVQSWLAEFRVTAEKAGLALTADIAPQLPLVSGDSLALHRVLDNLLGNAFKFTPKGGQVTVRLQRQGENVVLQVADTGIGIPSDQLRRVFERFYQVDGSATRRFGGIGLGLALVKEIAEAHGGRVTVTSQVGVGTTFTVSLPVQEPG